MMLSTIERAFQLARSGEVSDLPNLKRRLSSEGCRAVDALLAPRTLSGHLAAICTATFKATRGAGPDAVTHDGR